MPLWTWLLSHLIIMLKLHTKWQRKFGHCLLFQQSWHAVETAGSVWYREAPQTSQHSGTRIIKMIHAKDTHHFSKIQRIHPAQTPGLSSRPLPPQPFQPSSWKSTETPASAWRLKAAWSRWAVNSERRRWKQLDIGWVFFEPMQLEISLTGEGSQFFLKVGVLSQKQVWSMFPGYIVFLGVLRIADYQPKQESWFVVRSVYRFNKVQKNNT